MNTSYRCAIGILAILLLNVGDSYGRGFGGGRGGGMSRGGGISRGGMSRSSGISRGGSFSRGSSGISRGSSYSRGGSFSSGRSSSIRSGGISTSRPSGSSLSRSSIGQRGGQSVTGPRGGSVTVGGARGAVKGPSGGAAGRVGGVKVEGPRGNTATKGGASGAIRGPGGAAAGSVRGGSLSGARGSVGGVQGRAAGRSFATDGGFARYKGGVAVRGARGGAVAVGHRTRAVSVGARRTTGVAVRRGVVARYPYRTWFTTGWYARYPRAWRAARWATATIWAAATWDALYRWWGWGTPAQPAPNYYYDYGNTIVYEGDTVYYGDQRAASAEEYYEQAASIASEGAVEVPEEEEWQSLGVFAMVQGDDSEADKILQLAVNKANVIRGNHYDALTETTLPIQGSVDQKTQRAAWTVGDNDQVVYETGIYNLTQEETEMLIHFGSDRTQQWSLVRLEEPEDTGEQQ